MPARSIEDVRSAASEFDAKGEPFECFTLGKDQWRDPSLLLAARPGVYVWFNTEQERVIRVGMSTINARARALEHIRDNTGKTMTAMAEQSQLTLVLFTREDKDKNSIAKLEKYLENALDPVIPPLN